MKPLIQFDQFAAMDLRIGKVINCEEKEGSDKLLRLTVSFGEESEKNILTGIKAWYQPAELIGKKFLFIINLEPRKMMGEFSEGMILAAEGEKPMPLTPIGDVPEGATIR
jgi:methionine--tRNA ligase beta chain